MSALFAAIRGSIYPVLTTAGGHLRVQIKDALVFREAQSARTEITVGHRRGLVESIDNPENETDAVVRMRWW